jgi:hypothetical protein
MPDGRPPKAAFGRLAVTETAGIGYTSVPFAPRRTPMRHSLRRSTPPSPTDTARCAHAAPPPDPARDARHDPSASGPRDGPRRRLLLLGLAIGSFAIAAAPRPARAQIVRSFPESARLGRLEMRVFPEAVLNDEPVRLAAGTRIHDADNRIVMPSMLSGTFDVLVERNLSGQVGRVWILTPGELAAAQARERASGTSGGTTR